LLLLGPLHDRSVAGLSVVNAPKSSKQQPDLNALAMYRLWTSICPQSEERLGEQAQKRESVTQSEVEEVLIEMAELAPVGSSRTKWRGGQLLHIHITPAASIKMQELAEANFVAGRGIEGDRYFLGTGTYSAKPDFREVTVFEMEVLEALARNDPPIQSGPIRIGPNDHRRNLTVTGVPLNHLVGQRFRVGDAVLFAGRLNFPCKYLERLLGLPVYLPLYNRSGLNCRIEKGGMVRCGDAVEPF
jgi:hypothetical protein